MARPPTTLLPEVRKALRAAHAKLPRGVTDMGYRVDVDAAGAECLVVHVATDQEGRFPFDQRRQIERKIAAALAPVIAWAVYFRWRTAAEDAAERHTHAKDDGGRLQYALH